MAQREILKTPKGPLKYAHLNQPDFKGAEKFGGEPDYKATVRLEKDNPRVAKLLKRLDELAQKALESGREQMDEANAKAKAVWKKKGVTEPSLNDPYEDEVDEEGNATGYVLIKVKSKYEFKDRKTGQMRKTSVKMTDPKGNVILEKKKPRVYSGSIVNLAFTTSPVFIPKDADVYLGMYLNEVRILELSQAGGGSAFGDDEDAEDASFSIADLQDNDDDASGGDDLEDDGDEDEGTDDDLDDEIPF